MLTTPVVNGGFDPVPVAARPGDSIDVVVADAGGNVVSQLTVAVAAARRPVVVRTNPPPKKRDHPLNAAIVIVFSEPVDPATVSTNTVRLLRGPTAVAGTAQLLVGSSTAAVFVPNQALNPNTDYELVVTTGVRDLSGDAVAAETRVSFATGTTVEGPVAYVQVTPDSGEMSVGSQYQFSATAFDAGGHVITGRPTTWTVYDTTVASITPSGLLTAKHAGGENVQAEVEGRSGNANLYISDQLPTVARVTVTPDTGTVYVGRAIELNAQAWDSAGNPLRLRLISWSSANPSVASVAVPGFRGTGVVTGRVPGVAAIIASAEGKSDTAFITVETGPAIVGFTLSPDTLLLALHGTGYLSGIASAADGWSGAVDPLDITWSSADPTVASVTAEGFVSAGQTGSTTITARWNGFTATADVRVVGLAFTTVSAGYAHACGLTLDGKASCWGSNGGLAGLGDGTTNSSPSPVAVAGGLTFTAISTGGYGACGLTSDGILYCWGYNGNGAIGDGTYTDRLSPVPVAGGHQFRSVSAGISHTCAIDVNGAGYCWGQNYNGAQGGKLGDGTFNNSPVPVAVTGGHTFAQISAGELHTCGVTTAGAAYCWGSNFAGALGIGTSGGDFASPVAVTGGLVLQSVGAGGSTSCGLATSRLAYCWGANGYGSVGNGAPLPGADVLQPVRVTGGLQFTALTSWGLGVAHSCALTSGGAAYCWGYNGGALGDGSVTEKSSPVAVAGGLTFANISAGDELTCGVTRAGVAYCWGNNYYGQLGNGSYTSSAVPVKVTGQQ